MNRRDFLARLGLGAATVALSPLLDLAPIIEAPSSIAIGDEFISYVTFSWRLTCHNPRSYFVITDIAE